MWRCFSVSSSMESERETGCLPLTREIHPLDPQPNRHSMLVPGVCAPRVTRCSLGRYWSRDLCSKQAAERLTGWLGTQNVILSRSDKFVLGKILIFCLLLNIPTYAVLTLLKLKAPVIIHIYSKLSYHQ